MPVLVKNSNGGGAVTAGKHIAQIAVKTFLRTIVDGVSTAPTKNTRGVEEFNKIYEYTASTYMHA